MKNILIFFLTASSFVSFSQSGYLKWLPSEKNNLVTDAIELPDSSFLIIGAQKTNVDSNFQTYIINLNNRGELIQESIGILSDTSSSYNQIFSMPNENNILNLISSNVYSNNDHKQHFITLKKLSTSNLSASEFRRFISPIDTFVFPQSLAITDSAVFIQSKICRNIPVLEPVGIIINKYDLNMTQKDDSYHDTRTSVFYDYLNIDTENQRLKYFFSDGQKICLKNFDFNLLPTSEKVVIPNTPFLSSVTKMIDSTFLITAMDQYSTPINHIKIVKLDQNDLKIDSTVYYNHPDSSLYAGTACNTAIVNDKIFVVSSKNLIPLQYPWQSTPTWLQITRLDTNMEILDHHFYGGDAVYEPYKILKTLDGGAVVIGNRYDCFNSTSNILNTFILKVDKNGLLSEITNNLNPISHSAIVFPNPGKEVLNLTSGIQLNHGMFTLYDMQGLPVFTKEINATEMQFDTSQLSSGSYVWQIVRNNKVMDSGKWVKE